MVSRKKKQSLNTADDGLDLIEFISWLKDLHSKSKEFADSFNEPWKTPMSNMVDGSFIAIGTMSLLFIIQLFYSIFTLNASQLFEHSYLSAQAGVVCGVTFFVVSTIRKTFRKNSN
jgi:hypothetical protein